MKVLIVGGSGVLGRQAILQLCAAGHTVRATATRDESLAIVRSLGAEPVRLDLRHNGPLEPITRGADAIIHLATRLPPLRDMRRSTAWRDNDFLRGIGTRRLVDAAIATAARIFVQESVCFLYPDCGDGWIDETQPIGEVPLYARSALDAEQQAARFARPGATTIVLRFAALYGPEAPSSVETATLVRRWQFPIIGSGRTFFSSVHTNDAGAAIGLSVTLPAGTYNVTDDEPLILSEYVRAIRAAVGGPPPLRVPTWFATRLGGDAVQLLSRSRRISNARLKAATPWAPVYPNARTGWRDIARRWAA